MQHKGRFVFRFLLALVSVSAGWFILTGSACNIEIAILPSTTLAPAAVPAGEIVLGNAVLCGATSPVVLNYNPGAVDPSYSQLVAFLNHDTTDQETYLSGVRVCADFAEEVYNDAEASGIRTAIVILSGVDHALDAFDTTDEGLVYIDCTGPKPGAVDTSVGGASFGEPTSWDKVAYIQVGSPVGFISLSAALNYGLGYSAYSQWLSDKARFDQDYAQYNSELAGRTAVPQGEYNELLAEQQIMTALANKLGAFWTGLDSQGVVTGVTLIWEGQPDQISQ